MVIVNRRTNFVLLLGLCALASLVLFSIGSLLLDQSSISSGSPALRRHLKAEPSRRVYSWARDHILPLTVAPDPSRETATFWHIPKSGGTTAKAIYECLGQTLASRAGAQPKFGHAEDGEVVAFHPWRSDGPSYVNVDTSRPEGILRAEEMGLVPSGKADLIVTGYPAFAIEHLYDESHKGRVLALFRHPIHRLVSKFYYLQVATWERAYNPSWKNVSIREFAEKRNNENNVMLKKLAGKKLNEQVTDLDLGIAMRTLEQRFIVGLMDQMEESIHRFNIVLGIDESEEENKKCMDRFFGEDAEKKNSNPHQEVKEGSPEWKAFAERNALDMRLYNFILVLFEQQRETIYSYTETTAT